jgi:hypothetical protein
MRIALVCSVLVAALGGCARRAPPGGGTEAYCKAELRAEELCTRFKPARTKKK